MVNVDMRDILMLIYYEIYEDNRIGDVYDDGYGQLDATKSSRRN